MVPPRPRPTYVLFGAEQSQSLNTLISQNNSQIKYYNFLLSESEDREERESVVVVECLHHTSKVAVVVGVVVGVLADRPFRCK